MVLPFNPLILSQIYLHYFLYLNQLKSTKIQRNIYVLYDFRFGTQIAINKSVSEI